MVEGDFVGLLPGSGQLLAVVSGIIYFMVAGSRA